MTFDVSGTVLLVALLVPVILTVALLSTPRWVFRSRSKHALWQLRDEVVDDTIFGRLPKEHDAVQELVARVEWAIDEARSFDLLHLWVWHRATGEIPDETRRRVPKVPGYAGLDPEASRRVEQYRMRYNRVAVRAVLLSSWLGVAMLLSVAVPLAIRLLMDRTVRRSVLTRVVLRDATDQFTERTSVGRSARAFVSAEGPCEAVVAV